VPKTIAQGIFVKGRKKMKTEKLLELCYLWKQENFRESFCSRFGIQINVIIYGLSLAGFQRRLFSESISSFFNYFCKVESNGTF
jgi:hypothetical protein